MLPIVFGVMEMLTIYIYSSNKHMSAIWKAKEYVSLQDNVTKHRVSIIKPASLIDNANQAATNAHTMVGAT